VTIVKLSWTLTNLATLLADGYDRQKIEIGTTTPPVVWTELTRPHFRPPIVANVERYLYECPADITKSFRAVPYRTSDGATTTPITITQKSGRGYCSVADIRAEGFANPPYSDARVQSAIDYSTLLIDRICGQRFDAYSGWVKLDVKKPYREHHLDVPICCLWQIHDSEGLVDIANVVVYNRHLTQGLENPDDRRNPMIAWGEERQIGVPESIASGYFNQGMQTLKVWGVFGFTEIGADDQVGETADGSQVPLSYGSTPVDIKYACMMLAVGRLATLASGGDESSINSRVISESTRDQSYSLQALPTEEASYGMTGNQQVDSILMRYQAPMRIGAV